MMGWVWLVPVAFLTVLLASRVRLLLRYDGAFTVSLRFWFFRFPRDKKTGKKAKLSVRKRKKTDRADEKPVFVPDWSFFLTNFSEVMELLQQLLSALSRRLTVDELFLDLRIHEEDAATTAIRYGQLCGAVYTVAGFFRSFLRVRRQHISVVPLFQEGETGAVVSVQLSICLFSILTLLASKGPGVAKMFLAFIRVSRQKAEDHAVHEPERTRKTV